MPLLLYPEIMVEMRDGVKLATDVYLPDSSGKFPVIVIRSPYANCSGRSRDAIDFCKQGIGFVVQDCRGTGLSKGEANLWAQEKQDAEDFFRWLKQQEWFNGRMVTNGESYPGATQWQAARNADPVMVGLTPHNAPLDFYDACYYPNGAYGFGIGAYWAFGVRQRREKLPEVNVSGILRHLPLRTMDEAAGIGVWPLFRTWMDHPLHDEYWNAMSAFSDIPKIGVPAYITGGWFDAFLMQTLHAFTAMRAAAATEKARSFTRLVIEPFNHDMALGDVDYGKFFRAGIIGIRNRFMRNVLADPDSDPLPDQPPVRLFVMGSNRWLNFNEWPVPCTPTPFYLDSKSPANTVRGGGRLSVSTPAGSPDAFTYSPGNPVPAAGGNNLGYMSSSQRIQTEVENRSDVLVYTSDALEKDLDVIGYVKAVLYASSSAPDTDFTVKLCDVTPDGKSYNVCDGLVRASHREGNDHFAAPLTPGEITRFEIDCWATAYTFLAGHRLRVQVSSSCFPRFDRNPNSGKPFGTDTVTTPANQTVYHDAEHLSHILLPVFS